jgi:hypothetical protein
VHGALVKQIPRRDSLAPLCSRIDVGGFTHARCADSSVQNSPEQVAAIGPGMLWNSGKWFFYVNGYHEFGVEDRPQGNKLVLRIERVF